MFTDQRLVSDKPPFKSLLNVLLTLILGIFIGPVVGLWITSQFFEGDLWQELLASSDKTYLFPYILLMQGIGSFVGFIIFPLLHLRVLEKKPLSPFFPAQQRLVFICLLVVLIGFSFTISISPVIQWNAEFSFPGFLKDFERWAREKEDLATELTAAATAFETWEDVLWGILVIALIPAIGEELIFRGLIQNELWRGTRNIHAGIWISAALFSAIHFQFYGFVPRLLLGALFGYLYYWSGNLLIPMVAHFFNNALSVVGVFLNKREIITTNPEDTEAAPWHTVLLCLIITVTLLYYFRKFYTTRKPNSLA